MPWGSSCSRTAFTGATGLSIASISTNTPIAGGGAYAIISRSLGLEAGGAIGVPLYLSQTLAIALYVFGFRGGWQYVFPHHPALVVDVLTFALLIGIASVSARCVPRAVRGPGDGAAVAGRHRARGAAGVDDDVTRAVG